MCGIAGYIKFKNNFKDSDIDEMVKVLGHRGPDSIGKKHFNDFNNFYSMGHARLSIIDLTEGGAQPMENHKYIICFNGEIYNYLEIKDTLKQNKIKFSTDSDTEVVLEAISYFGIEKHY